ncbi:sulfatase family protein [Pontiella sulfatireligans]|uniref:Arylsulfatase n=1 Tax=Pontiella sulfatireligans TaxID=2750658 RepID=A0A6C2UM72_9BACT|nr:sulfatase [Pontiella sulfatireligans]SPS74407.1 sulfatase S1_8 [Kiritimatiellales bacterium]VGO20404.1 Arylsulfatase [Pontiella sulfatireligans]
MIRNRIKEQVFRGLFAMGTAVFTLSQAYAETSEPAPPNIIFIIGDDISAADFGCYGHPTIKTPNIDLLAANGLRFSNAYLTISQCSPTRCSIITGRYPHNTGAPELHMALPKGQVMFPALLNQAGYYTVAAGKWHLGNYAKKAFDKVVDSRPGGEERWVQCLQERPKDKPFFMWFASHDAHRSWQEDEEAAPHSPEDAVIPPYLIDTQETRADLAKYYDEIQRLDRYAGMVVDELKKQGVLENTFIIFMADNGRPFPRCKTRLYDSGIKTPFIVHWPAGLKQRGEVCHSLISAIDIAPTLLDLSNVKTPPSFQGISILPLLHDPEKSIRKYVFAEHNWHVQIAHERMVRHGNYVYIRNAHPQLPQICGLDDQCPQRELRSLAKEGKLTPAQMDPLLEPRPAEELFDVSNDPHQIKDLARNPEYAQVLENMRTLMDEWQASTGDTTPPLDKATPDRNDRRTGKLMYENGTRPQEGIVPGQSTEAQHINHSGPR